MVSFTNHYNAISIDRLPSKTKIGKDLWKRFRKIIPFCVSQSPPQLQKLLLLLKTQKTTTLEQVAVGNTPNLVLKRMLRYFSKGSTTQEYITISRKNLSLLKTQKATSSASAWWRTPNSSFKENARIFSKIFHHLRKN